MKNSGWSGSSANRFNKKYFSEKKPNSQLLSFIYVTTNKKYCKKCHNIKSLNTDFYEDNRKADNKQPYCKDCTIIINENTRKKRKEYYSKLSSIRTLRYRLSKINRTPSWSDLDKIKEIYLNCPYDHHVDHIIPLQGERVSGLHVPENLQYLPARENLSKGNRYIIE